MQFDRVYVAMWEQFDDYGCVGRDLYMSLDYDKAVQYIGTMNPAEDGFVWENDMWFRPLGKYGWEKYYIDIRMLEEEL